MQIPAKTHPFMTAFAATVLFAGMTFGPGQAQEFCSEPIAPSCISAGMDLDSTLQAKRCEEDLNRYEQNFETYEACLTKKLAAMRDEIDTFRDTLRDRTEDAAEAEGGPAVAD